MTPVQIASSRGAAILEQAGSRWASLGHWYGQVFYRNMLEREVEAAGLEPGGRIIHVGCGSLPITAIYLGEKGFRVLAVDRDPAAVSRARDVICREGLEDRVDVQKANGESADCSGFDAIWISFHVEPRDKVLDSCLASLKEGGRVVLRTPSGMLAWLYSEASGVVEAARCLGQVAHKGGKKSMVLEKATGLETNLCRGLQRLCDLAPGQEGVIMSQGDHPLLSPLGFRVGKTVRIQCRQFMGGPLVADLDGKRVAVDRNLASQIGVSCV